MNIAPKPILYVPVKDIIICQISEVVYTYIYIYICIHIYISDVIYHWPITRSNILGNSRQISNWGGGGDTSQTSKNATKWIEIWLLYQCVDVHIARTNQGISWIYLYGLVWLWICKNIRDYQIGERLSKCYLLLIVWFHESWSRNVLRSSFEGQLMYLKNWWDGADMIIKRCTKKWHGHKISKPTYTISSTTCWHRHRCCHYLHE